MVDFICVYKQNNELQRAELQGRKLPGPGDFVGVGGDDLIVRVEWRYLSTTGGKPVVYGYVICEEHAALWKEALTYVNANNRA